ncbi:hypothetical protein GGP41_003742 [Bipolaris sorokiniana]|uniref:DUF1264 domain protein n=2 Tax=Cochliobolus sativus TaxID=45130 RepID=A0A8H5ZBL9_COCSA|nr:uncharacterized protein COCSADRAFT_160084 [Bipolaris sorokiniana ND90Pr]EMD65099.1 hypothetical protein COCSADRAFT_160084 [Bipolaris sorokiniana ND90Pr]KAF5846321.1 hypothetical protein GGP41_003742 [Bipolaris sorokiniana]
MDSLPVNNKTAGEAESTYNKTLETGAGATQNFAPVKRVCAHLNAFHAYADDPKRAAVEANHYCAHLNDEVRQCILYDSPEPGARIIGIEYMISPKLYATLPTSEQTLWHSHVFEVKSGMLIMPRPSGIPEAAWELAENREMEEVVQLYGKIYHLWQTDRGDKLPLGPPQLMTSYTAAEQMPDFEARIKERDERFGSDYSRKKGVREYIEVPEIHENADATWAKGGVGHGGASEGSG